MKMHQVKIIKNLIPIPIFDQALNDSASGHHALLFDSILIKR
ncbi:hypothetical protein [Staphylococcus delphini]